MAFDTRLWNESTIRVPSKIRTCISPQILLVGRHGLEPCSGHEFFFHFRDVCRKPLVSYLYLSFIYPISTAWFILTRQYIAKCEWISDKMTTVRHKVSWMRLLDSWLCLMLSAMEIVNFGSYKFIGFTSNIFLSWTMHNIISQQIEVSEMNKMLSVCFTN